MKPSTRGRQFDRQVTVKIGKEDFERLDAYARERGLRVSQILRSAALERLIG